jgi:hypothetical protein
MEILVVSYKIYPNGGSSAIVGVCATSSCRHSIRPGNRYLLRYGVESGGALSQMTQDVAWEVEE